MSESQASASAAPTPRSTRPGAAIFIIGTVLIDAMGFGLVMPVLPSLLMELTQSDVGSAARWGGLATFVYAIMQFACSPIVGGLSDRFGRRPVLLISLAALAVDYVLMGLAHAVWVFFLARLISGVFAATHSTANAYIADTTSGDKRAMWFGWIGAAFGVGFILGPMIGGLLGGLSPRAPFYAAAVLAAVNAAYGFFFVPESLRAEHRRPFSWARANAFGTLMQLRRAKGLGMLVAVMFLSSLSTFVYPAVWSYTAIAKFNWSEAQIGASLAVFGLIFAFSQAAMVPLLLPRIGVRRIIWIALALESIALMGIATAPSGAYVYAWLSLSLITGMQGPALQQVMTERAGADAQGELQGGLSALNGVVMIISPLLYTQLLFAFDRGVMGVRFPGAPFVVASGISVAALILFLARRRRLTAAVTDLTSG